MKKKAGPWGELAGLPPILPGLCGFCLSGRKFDAIGGLFMDPNWVELEAVVVEPGKQISVPWLDRLLERLQAKPLRERG